MGIAVECRYCIFRQLITSIDPSRVGLSPNRLFQLVPPSPAPRTPPPVTFLSPASACKTGYDRKHRQGESRARTHYLEKERAAYLQFKQQTPVASPFSWRISQSCALMRTSNDREVRRTVVTVVVLAGKAKCQMQRKEPLQSQEQRKPVRGSQTLSRPRARRRERH